MPFFEINVEIEMKTKMKIYCIINYVIMIISVVLCCCFTVTSEVCDSVGSSKLQWRGLSRAACVPQETSDSRRKSGQKVPKHERKAMVESFVNKYFLCFF
jgi:hypothetical protein